MARYRVAVVDDDPDALSLLGEYLELSGFEVQSCCSSMHAVFDMEMSPPDVVLLDIQMPGKDGFQVLTELRAHPRLEDVPVIFVSSLDRPNLKVKGLELGADDFVVKPFNRAELLARLRVSLRRSARFRHLAGCLGGDLADVPLHMLLQTLGLGGKTATVRLPGASPDPPSPHSAESPEQAPNGDSAWIAIDRGRFAGARFGRVRGLPALARLCLLEAGRFETAFDKLDDATREAPRPVDGALLDAAVEIDEAGAMLAPLGGIDVALIPIRRLAEGAEPFEPVEPPTPPTGSATTARRLLLLSEGPLSAAARRILAAVERGELKAAAAPRGG